MMKWSIIDKQTGAVVDSVESSSIHTLRVWLMDTVGNKASVKMVTKYVLPIRGQELKQEVTECRSCGDQVSKLTKDRLCPRCAFPVR